MRREHHSQFDLLSNARDSLRQAVELLAWRDVGSDHARLALAGTVAQRAGEIATARIVKARSWGCR